MTLALSYLFSMFGAAVVLPELALGFLMAFAESSRLQVFGTTVRALSVPLVAIGIVCFCFSRKGYAPRECWIRLTSNSIFPLCAVFTAWLILGYANLLDSDRQAAKIFYLYCLTPLLLGAALIKDMRAGMLFVAGLVLGVMAQSAFELLQWSNLATSVEESRLAMSTSGLSRMLFSGWGAITFSITLCIMMTTKVRWVKVLSLLVCAYTFMLLMLTGTRSAFIALVVVMIGMAIQNRRLRRFVLVSLTGSLLAGYALITLDNPLSSRLAAFIQDPASEGASRLELYSKALMEDFPDAPVIGTGLFGSGEDVRVIEWDRNQGALETGLSYRINYENIFLTMLVECGLMGSIIMASVVIRLVLRSKRLTCYLPWPWTGPIEVVGVIRLLLAGSLARNCFSGTLGGATDLLTWIMLLSSLIVIRPRVGGSYCHQKHPLHDLNRA